MPDRNTEKIFLHKYNTIYTGIKNLKFQEPNSK